MRRKVDRDALLAAFRAERGPSRDVEERLWTRLRADVDAASRSVPTGVSSPGRYVLGFAALAAVAAAAIIVVLWPDGGVLEVQDSDGAPSMAAHERKAVSDATASPVEAERPLHEDPTHDAVLEHSAEVDAAASVVEPDLSRPISSRSHERRPRSGEAQDSLAEETRLLRQARAALGQGEPRRALAVLSEYERAHPSGLLAEEADAVRTIAKCRMQSTAGRELARSFSARHRSSLFRGQVQAACVLEEDEGM